MAQNSLIQVRVDKKLKKEADELFTDLGLDTPTAIRIFLKHSIHKRGIPFEVGLIPNAETIEAIKEAERIGRDSSIKGYTDINQMMGEILNDV